MRSTACDHFPRAIGTNADSKTVHWWTCSRPARRDQRVAAELPQDAHLQRAVPDLPGRTERGLVIRVRPLEVRERLANPAPFEHREGLAVPVTRRPGRPDRLVEHPARVPVRE